MALENLNIAWQKLSESFGNRIIFVAIEHAIFVPANSLLRVDNVLTESPSRTSLTLGATSGAVGCTRLGAGAAWPAVHNARDPQF